jgi:hypothetical protein
MPGQKWPGRKLVGWLGCQLARPEFIPVYQIYTARRPFVRPIAKQFYVRTESLSTTIRSALIIGIISILVVEIFSALSFPDVMNENLQCVDFPFVNWQEFNPKILELMIGQFWLLTLEGSVQFRGLSQPQSSQSSLRKISEFSAFSVAAYGLAHSFGHSSLEILRQERRQRWYCAAIQAGAPLCLEISQP